MHLRAALAAVVLLTSSASPPKQQPVAVDTNELPSLHYDAGSIKFIVPAEATNGEQSVVELTELPGYKTAWHQHDAWDESFYVVEGVLTMKLGDKIRELPAGSFVRIPRGTPHGQGNFGDRPVRLLLTLAPAGFEAFFKDRVELFKTIKPGHPEFQARFDELRARHRQWVRILGTWQR